MRASSPDLGWPPEEPPPSFSAGQTHDYVAAITAMAARDTVETVPGLVVAGSVPQRPLPYRELSVSFAGGAAGVTLAGTITAPPGGRGPAVVFISGSGPHNRDSEEFGHNV